MLGDNGGVRDHPALVQAHRPGPLPSLHHSQTNNWAKIPSYADEMRRLFAYLALVLASTLVVSPAPGQTISGQWCGEGDQIGPGYYRSRWAAILVLDGPTGRMDYPSLACGGTLTFERAEGSVSFFRERIDYGHGRCIDGGLIGIEAFDAAVRWEWNGSGAAANAVLTSQCRLQSQYKSSVQAASGQH